MSTNRRTALYHWHTQNGGKIVPFGGWDMPVQYSGIVAEHQAVRTAVGLFDISHMARVSFAGADVEQLLETIFTNSVASMAHGQVRYGLVCNETGGILDDILVYRWSYGFATVINASNREKIVAWLQKHSAGRDVQIDDRTERTAMIAVQGPKSVDLLAGMLSEDVSHLKYYYSQPCRYQAQPCIVSRTGYTGEDGYELIIANELAESMWNELRDRGAVPCGLGARDTLRLEAAMPLYGHELSENINPLQAGLGWAVKLQKGAFIGREALIQSAKPTTPVRIGLELEGKRAAREGCPILTADGIPIGTVTSGSYAPGLQKSIAMGYVPTQHTAVGSGLLVDIRGTMTPAQVVKLPFYKRS